MTPEDSQSSEELVNSEGSHTASPSTSSNTDPPIRVRNVAEINSTEGDGLLGQTSKSKQPSWMFVASQRECSSPKRRKQANSYDDDAPCASTSRAALNSLEVCVTHSTSSDEVQEDTRQTASTSDTRPESNHDEEEASTSCEIDENEAEAEIKFEPEMESEPIPSTSRGYSTPSRSRRDDVAEDGVRVVGEILPPSPDIKPAKEVQKEEATSSTARPTCPFGIRCIRQKPTHRHEEAHPGDPDYRRPDYPPAPDGAPDCPFGLNCYRRNPVHFQQYKHPPTTDFDQNWRNYKMRLRTRRQREDPNANHPSSSSMQESSAESEEDQFANDESEEFVPNEDDEDEEDEDDEYV